MLNRWAPIAAADENVADATAMDAEDDEEDAQHLQKEYISDQLQLAKDRGNT